MIYTSIDRQNLFDMAIIGSGACEEAFAIAYANGLIISNRLNNGSQLTVNSVSNADVVDYFKRKITKPATGDNYPSTFTFDETFDISFNAPINTND